MSLSEFREEDGVSYRSLGLDRQGREVWLALPEWRLQPYYMELLDHGYLQLDSYMASDAIVCDSARVLPEQRVVGELAQRDRELIDSMLAGRQGTPFEQAVFRFRAKAPLFVLREWMRHRLGSYNEISYRWQQAQPDFYLPRPAHVRQLREGASKDYEYEPLDPEQARRFAQGLDDWHHECWELYQTALYQGVAPEQARYFLPLTVYSVICWTVNARALMNFLSLCNEAHASWELRQYAEAVESLFAQVMPVTHASFGRHGRRAP
jgi:thymidylate synthase (FAD)